MTPTQTANLISKAGGDSAFGRLLGLDKTKGWQQRVNNWKRRGLPASVMLENYDVIRSLRGVRDRRTGT